MSETNPMHSDSVRLPVSGKGSGLNSSAMKKTALALIIAGGALSLPALFFDANRFGFAYLWGFTFVWSVSLGSLFFVALHHLTRSVWSVVIRRAAEMLASPLGVIVLLFVPLVLFVHFEDRFSLFPWADPEIVEGDHVLESKKPYLNAFFFSLRGFLFLGLWYAFARFFINASIKQDNLEEGSRMRKWSAPFMIVFALTVTFASFDWLMSLEPHWFSTIFGVYVFSGMVICALSALTITVIGLRARGELEIVTKDHLYSLGALLFAFTCFWAYIAFSQFMLIWYGNMPEETVYFAHRAEHGWLALSILLAALRFVLPFFLLLSRGAKMNARRLVLVAAIGIAGELLDLYWLIMPQIHRDGPRLGWQELGPLLLLSGIVLLFFVRFFRRHGMAPAGDPLFDKSCAFRL